MPPRRHHRFAHDVRQISADREISVQTDQAQRGAGNETPAYSKKSAENPDKETYNNKIDRADVRPGNWKKHGLFGAAPNEANQEGGDTFKNNGLTNDE